MEQAGFVDQGGVTVGIGPVTFDDVAAVARHDAKIVIADEAWAEVGKSREIIEALADGQEPHYGVSTGFGALATRHIPLDLRGQLQRSLIRSHAAGSGPEVEREVVRALMLLRISTLATGRTGIREETLRCYVAMVNAGLTPVVYEYGSLGCSGDLAPLAHCALALMGEGIVRDPTGTLLPTRRCVRSRGHNAGQIGREGGPGLDQRHRRDAWHAGARDHRSPAAAQAR
jgi:histidine ammonia-lyase